MKRFLLLIALLSTSFMFSQEVTHVDFDTNNPDIGFESWNTSATFMKVPNPTGVSDPNNISPFVGQFTAGTSDWGQDNTIGIGVVNATSVFSTPFDLTSLDYFKMNVLTLEEVTITFHLENSPDYGNNIEATASISAAQLNQWVELTFDFSSFSNIWMNNIVIKVDGPAWTTSDILFFDDIKGPQLYTSPGLEYNPLNASTEVSLGTNLEIATNDKFYDAGAATITDFTGKVALRVGDINGADVPFTASINGDNNRITIDPDTDLDGLTTYWYGIIDNTIYYSTGTSITGVSASFTTKEAVVGDINVMLFDYETVDTDTPFESWGTAGFAQISNPAPDAVNGSSNVGEFTHPGGSWTSGIESQGTFDNIDFSETPYFRIKVWADKPIEVTFKLQNNPNYWENNEIKYQISSDEINQWIQLTLNFGAITATNYNRVQLWFDGDISGGSVAGDKYYFDDIEKSNVPPAASNTLIPADGATDIVQYSKITISSNFQFRNIDDSAITDANSIVELRENDNSGALVPFAAAISSSKNTLTILPDNMLSSGATYWYGIKEGMIEYVETEGVVSGVNATFTVTNDPLPEMQVYNNFDGTSVCLVSESMGDPAGTFNLSAVDPVNGSNTVMQWDKGASWSGWERIHFQLDAPFNAALDDVFSFKVYSPVTAGVRFKLSDAKDDWDQTGFYETDEEIIFANQWQTIYLDTSLLADGVNFDHIFIFLGRGDNTNTTFYIDDFKGPYLQGTASVNDFNNNEVLLYPNPAKNKVFFKNIFGTKNIRIFDINGRVIDELSIESNEMSIEHLYDGLYFLEINGQVKKLIKK